MHRRATGTGWVPLALTVLLSACSNKPSPEEKPPPTGGGDTSAAPLSVSGTALDTQGRPLANASVIIEPAITKGAVTVRTGADGRYKVESLPDVPYYANAWTEVDFNGKHFCLRLGMPNASDYEAFNVRNGAVRNFRWMLTGRIGNATGEGAHFGGTTKLDLSGDFTDGTLELTFTPTSKLLDGSDASPLTRTVPVGQTGTVDVEDVPVANYTVSGVLIQGANRREVHIGKAPAGTFAEQTVSAPLTFSPSDGGCVATSGVAATYLFVNSPDEG